MKKIVILLMLMLGLRLTGSVSANHTCGNTCDQFTDQGVCTHGCWAGGGSNPDFHAGEPTVQSAPAEMGTDGGNQAVAQKTVQNYNDYLNTGNNNYQIDPNWHQGAADTNGDKKVTLSELINQSSGSGPAAGTAASCWGLGGGQIERDCLARATSGTYISGQCRGLSSVAACVALGTAVYCSGKQEAAGSLRAGEFLDCGKSSTGGCGQVDVYNPADVVNGLPKAGAMPIGFVIDKTGCGGTAPTTVTPAAPPREIPPPPPPPPPPGLMCTSLNGSTLTPDIGQSLTLTCKAPGTSTVDHFEFRYKIGSGAFINLPAGTAQSGSGGFIGTSQLTVATAGNYEAQCRVCQDAAGTACTSWGMDL